MAGKYIRRMKLPLLLLRIAALSLFSCSLLAQESHVLCSAHGFSANVGTDQVAVTFVSTNIIHVRLHESDSDSFALSPAPLHSWGHFSITPKFTRHSCRWATDVASITLGKDSPLNVEVQSPAGKKLIAVPSLAHDSSEGKIHLSRFDSLDLYGMRGIEREVKGSLIHNDGAEIVAGAQGDAGGPFLFTTEYAVLVGSDCGRFNISGRDIEFENSIPGRRISEYYIVIGSPLKIMSAVADLTGHSPLPPSWTLGFINSQWGSNQADIINSAKMYREKQIPLTAFVLDFDWKAWGEDNYGEWRWNSSTTNESFRADLFPDGSSGQFAQTLRSQNIFLAGILKPRILLYKKDTNELHEAAAYAEAHHLWYPEEPATNDYFTKRASRDLDFSIPETRTWFWNHLEPAFDSGIVGWWNDEADHTLLSNGKIFDFNSLQFAFMGQALYDGQRHHSDLRVWSLNRNFYMGAQRYGYAEWSGDIDSGFASMKAQAIRMLATLNLGEPHWSMDAGGYKRDPDPENYARWIQFAAFVPIMRVHGALNLKRQPWAFGSKAEAAATHAIRTRAALFPYISSAERSTFETGIGIVRPLLWLYPDDPRARRTTSEWMFGDAILASPILDQGETIHETYLPKGTWVGYSSGKRYEGGVTIAEVVDAVNWTDSPTFVKEGSIIAVSDNSHDTNHRCTTALDVFPASQRATYAYYDDDGLTYSYERGQYFRQDITAVLGKNGLTIQFSPATGSSSPTAKCVVLRIHQHDHLQFASPPAKGKRTKPCLDSESHIANGLSPDESHVGSCVVVELSKAPLVLQLDNRSKTQHSHHDAEKLASSNSARTEHN